MSAAIFWCQHLIYRIAICIVTNESGVTLEGFSLLTLKLLILSEMGLGFNLLHAGLEGMGIFMCLMFCRSLGVHLSKVRSLTLDSWDPEQIKVSGFVFVCVCVSKRERPADGQTDTFQLSSKSSISLTDSDGVICWWRCLWLLILFWVYLCYMCLFQLLCILGNDVINGIYEECSTEDGIKKPTSQSPR